jgi:phosphodiesterase/alkaline phosphatase D-like protein
MGNAQYEWLKANLDQARIMWEIVGFYDVPDELINQHTKPGLNNPEAANRLMQEYRL